MTIPAFNTTNDAHKMVITTEVITAASVRTLLADQFGYEVKAVYRDGQVARIIDNGISAWVFIFSHEDAQLLTFETPVAVETVAPVASGKSIEYDRETRDYAMYYEGALVGFAKTYGDAEKALDLFVYELLSRTVVETADMEAEAIIADDDAAQRWFTRLADVVDEEMSEANELIAIGLDANGLIAVGLDVAADVADLDSEEPTDWHAASVESSASFAAAETRCTASGAALATAVASLVVPVGERVLGLLPGAHELDDGDVQAAYVAALAHPEMDTKRWQNALRKAFDHLREDRFVIAINNQGAYCWWAVDGEGGSYQTTPATCQCIAFGKDQPCKHRAASILLSFLADANDVGAEIDALYRLVMREVMRCAA